MNITSGPNPSAPPSNPRPRWHIFLWSGLPTGLARFRLKVRYGLGLVRYRHLSASIGILACVVAVLVAAIIWADWFRIDVYLFRNALDATRQLAVAIGVAITGLVAIVFSLTLFTVQQAADKGTATIFEEFSRDFWLWTIYWLLAVFAVGSFLLALLPEGHNFLTAGAICEFTLIGGTFVVLFFHFRRAIRLVSARGIIKRFHQRGVSQLRNIKKLEDDLIKGGMIRPPSDPERHA